VGAPVAIHRALLMVTAVAGRETRVRLLQNWGGVD
jgi:hypothetical protein